MSSVDMEASWSSSASSTAIAAAPAAGAGVAGVGDDDMLVRWERGAGQDVGELDLAKELMEVFSS
jgi:hypothetical protein